MRPIYSYVTVSALLFAAFAGCVGEVPAAEDTPSDSSQGTTIDPSPSPTPNVPTEPGGSGAVSPTPPSPQPDPAPPIATAGPFYVEISPTTRQTAPATVTLTVTNRDGPVPGLGFVLVRSGVGGPVGKTDADGRLVLTNLLVGNYTLISDFEEQTTYNTPYGTFFVDAPTSSGTEPGRSDAYVGSGFVLATSLESALSSMMGASGDDIRMKLLNKFPSSGGHAVGIYLSDASLQHLGDPANLLRNHASVLVMKGFTGDVTKLHYLRVSGKSHDLATYLGTTTSVPIRLIIADSQTEASLTTMTVKDITGWRSADPTFAASQGFAFGTTMKTITKTASVAGVVTGGTASAALETINRLPFDVGVYDVTQFEGTNPSDTRSYHVTAVRFLPGTTPELIELAQPPYTLPARNVEVKGFLVPLNDPASTPGLSTLADQWTGKSNVLAQLSAPPSSPLTAFASNDVLGAFGKGTQNHQQAKAVFLVTELALAKPVGSHRLKDVTAATFTAPVTHTTIQGYAAPTGGQPPMSILMDFSFSNGQPKIYQMPVAHPNVAGAVTIEGIFIRTNAQDAALAQAAASTLTQNQWARTVADAGATWSNVIVTNNGVLFPYKVTPTALGAPLPMLLKLSGNQLSWTPTIANNFAKYEIRQSSFPPTSATDGTLLATITNAQTTTHTLSGSPTGYIVVWAFNDQGNTASTPVYVEQAPTVGLTSVTYCTSNIRTCLHATWTQYSGNGFEKYELQRRSGSSWSVVQTITSASTTSAADNGLTCGTMYDYKVVIYANGKTGESNVMSGNPNNGYGFCDQPTTSLNYVVYCSSNQKTCLKSGWTAYNGQGFEKYELQRRVGASGSWTVATTITNSATTDYSDNGLTCGTTYNYRIVLYVAGGSSESNVLAGNPNNGFGGCF